VDELVDASALAAAFQCAAAGKLIFAGLPAPGVRAMAGQLAFLKDRFPALPWYTMGVAACKGVRVLCQECKEVADPPSAEIPYLKERPHVLFRATGCPACRNTGSSGVRYLVETALLDGPARDGDIMRRLAKEGFSGILEEAGDMLRAGDLSLEDFIELTTSYGEQAWQE